MANLGAILGLGPLRWLAGWWMKRRWNDRSRRNAAHAIADFSEDWSDMELFFSTGRDDVDKLLALAGWSEADTAAWRLLEIGCGAGRMTRHLASRFSHVVGVDVSGEMIRQARALNPGLKNVEFVEGSGVDLRGIEDESFDAALSYIVFQHIPSRQIVYGYIREVLRVLKPGGCFVFQARNDFAHRWTGTYAGDSVVVSDVVNVARSHGRDAQVLKGEGTQYCYFLIGPRVSG